MPYDSIFKYCEYFVPKLLLLSELLGKIPKIGIYIRRMVPVANIRGIAPLSEENIKNWALLYTFDMYAARYDRPATVKTVRKWFTEAGLSNVEVIGIKGLVIGSGMKSSL